MVLLRRGFVAGKHGYPRHLQFPAVSLLSNVSGAAATNIMVGSCRSITDASGPASHRIMDEDVSDRSDRQLQRLQKEVLGLRTDVQRLTAMLEQDFVGYRRGSEESSSLYWRTSLDGSASLSQEPGEREMVRPSVATAKMQPAHMSEMGHNTIAHLAISGNHYAHRERVLREIMTVDNVSWEEAHKQLAVMDEYKEQHYWFVTMPYRIGVVAATFFGIGSCLLVFHPSTAEWYGIEVAGEELPEDKKSVNEMTINQVGTWTWSWMEPMIGTASFVLLCAQFMRAQFIKLQMKTFLEIMESHKADMLATKFPQYDRSIIRSWAKPLPRAKPNFFPIYERSTGLRGPSTGL
jgi:hypothetical protein